MRLMHFIHTPRHSGAEMLVYSLCKLHRAWGHECAIASFAPPQPEFIQYARDLEQVGVKLFFPAHSREKLGRVRHYRDALCTFQADVVFAHSELPSLYGRFATGGGRQRAKFVTVMHSSTNFSAGSTMVAERTTRFRVDNMVAVSEWTARNYTKQYGHRIPVTIISNGIDLGSYSGVNRDVARQKLGLHGDERIALQVGRISDIKQQLWTLRALRSFLEEGKLRLWYAGLTEEEGYEKKLRQAIDEWKLQDAVQLLGSRSDIPELLAAADIYLMPSKREAQGIAMLEALASGVPILASDIPAFKFAREFEAVFVSDTRDVDASVQLLADALSSKRVHRDLSDYSINHTADAYVALAEKLVVRGNPDGFK